MTWLQLQYFITWPFSLTDWYFGCVLSMFPLFANAVFIYALLNAYITRICCKEKTN